MLLKAVPETQKEELIAGKNFGAFAIMAHLQILHQPCCRRPGGEGNYPQEP